MGDIQRIIEKVAKLRALATWAGTREEAEAALAQAALILDKYRLSEADVELANVGATEEPSIAGDPLVDLGKRGVAWRERLAVVIGKHFGCFVYKDAGGATMTIRIVGRPSDVALARHMFAWTDAEVTRLSMREQGRAARNSFCHGCVSGFRDALQRGAEEAKVVHHQDGGRASLANVGRVDAAKRVAEGDVGGRFQTQRAGSPTDSGAFYRGRQAGGGMNSGPALGAGRGLLPAAVGR